MSHRPFIRHVYSLYDKDGNCFMKWAKPNEVMKALNTNCDPVDYIISEGDFCGYKLVVTEVAELPQERLKEIYYPLWFIREWNNVRKRVNPKLEIDEVEHEKPYI